MVNIEIDEGSGFCFGVTTAIRKAEEELAKGNTLYCQSTVTCTWRTSWNIRYSPYQQHRDHWRHLSGSITPPKAHQTGVWQCSGKSRHTNRDLWQERSCRSTGAGRSNSWKSNCHRNTCWSCSSGLHQRHTLVLPDNQVFGRILANHRIYQGAYLTRCHFWILRHNLPASGQPDA